MLHGWGISMQYPAHIKPAAAYTLPEAAVMISVSATTARRLIDRGHLAAAPKLQVLRVTHASLESFLAAGAMAPKQFNLTQELRKRGPVLCLEPEEIAAHYRLNLQTVYRKISKGFWKVIPNLPSRRVLKAIVCQALGMDTLPPLGSNGPIERYSKEDYPELDDAARAVMGMF